MIGKNRIFGSHKEEMKDNGHEKCKRRKHGRRGKRRIVAGVIAAALIYLIAGALLPFVKQPKISEETADALDVSKFYSDSPSQERARVISQNGEALAERVRLISQAREEVILSTFEFDADISGRQVLAALLDAAERGVRVSVLADGFSYPMQMWRNPYFMALAQSENAEIRIYNPVNPLKPWTFMGRLHDKYLIADDTAYILGGRNTYDYFLGDQPGYKNYDWDVLVYSGETLADGSLVQVKDYFTGIWEGNNVRTVCEDGLFENKKKTAQAHEELRALYKEMQDDHPEWFLETDPEETAVSVNHVELISNPVHIYAKEPVVYDAITELMKQAKEEVVFHTPYIICNDWMLERLKEVCADVPEVTMMTNSVANNGNPFGAMDYKKYKGEILGTGVQILEYDGGVSYHGKCFTIDDRISAIGSFNWDMRSAYLDTELMLVIDSRELNSQLRREMLRYENDALRVVDETSYDLKNGQTPQEISQRRALRIEVLGALAGWARFLM